jgi:hypothetical protein
MIWAQIVAGWFGTSFALAGLIAWASARDGTPAWLEPDDHGSSPCPRCQGAGCLACDGTGVDRTTGERAQDRADDAADREHERAEAREGR